MLFNVDEIFLNTFHNYNLNILNYLQSKKDKRPWKLMPCQICIPKNMYVCVIFSVPQEISPIENNKITVKLFYVGG